MDYNLYWFLVTKTEDDKKLHKIALLNFLNNFYHSSEKISDFKCDVNILNGPYKIDANVNYCFENEKKMDKWNILIQIPINPKFYNDAKKQMIDGEEYIYDVNPWENTKEWKEFMGNALTYNFEIAKTIRDVNGIYNIKDRNAFDSVTMTAFHEFGGSEIYPNVIDKAAMILYTVVKNHPFSDGNKRTGFLTMLSFLQKCGLTLLIEKKSTINELVEVAEDFMITVAKSNPSEMYEILEFIKRFILEHINIDSKFQNYMIKLAKLNGGQKNG
jgi:death-on-curing protein